MKQSTVVQLIEEAKQRYAVEIAAMTGKGPGRLTKKTAEELKAGFADGVRAGVHAALAAAGVTVERD